MLYNYSTRLTVRLTVDKTGMLEERWIEFEIVQEYSGGGKEERIALGNVKLNLAEYVEMSELMASERVARELGGGGMGGGVRPGSSRGLSVGGGGDGDGDECITRRYLMQDSKINSTLKIGVFMKLIEGEKNFVCPPLRTAQVFSGIAGIVSGEQGDAEEVGSAYYPLSLVVAS